MISTTYLKSDNINFFHKSNDILNKETIFKYHDVAKIFDIWLIYNKFRNIAQLKQITLKTVHVILIFIIFLMT